MPETHASLKDLKNAETRSNLQPMGATYVHMVYAAALRQIGDVHLAEDVTQAVFAVLARGTAAGKLPKEARMAGWLLTAARGVQYACDDYRKLLADAGMDLSMSHKGDCFDNAAMESFWSTLKTEEVHHRHYATRDQARAAIFEYIEVFYNRKRVHSALGYVSPEVFEASLN
jgi:putative transposase